ncbi:TATA-box-binding protein [Halococcus hamelinensis]|uniref:TATA-box-binding protein n=1 Tax=Halococcus hamelinensis 100A6 TaxID=1132509 RepID=M0M831_9EURY|nr:TATA-box-binding protein [Halococcus hamelinensis]EMA41977.1 transcription factor [Halococcus hamelinensis 100A6]
MVERSDVEPYIEALEIQNVVASSAIGQEIDLEALVTDLEGVDFDPEQFPGLIYRIEEPHATALIFRSGKLVCTGADSVDGVHEALASTFETLSNLGLRVNDNPTITVQNIVVSGDLGATLNLNAIAIGLGLEAIEYEPEQFPGLVYRLEEPKVVALLFGSGKTVITGCKQFEDAEEATEVLVDRLSDLSLLG